MISAPFLKLLHLQLLFNIFAHWHWSSVNEYSPKSASIKAYQIVNCGQNSSSIIQGLYSLSGQTSYRKISWSIEAVRFRFILFQSLWNLTALSGSLSNFRAMRSLKHPISRLWDFTRFGGKKTCRLVNRGPGARHTKDISIRFEIRPTFGVL